MFTKGGHAYCFVSPQIAIPQILGLIPQIKKQGGAVNIKELSHDGRLDGPIFLKTFAPHSLMTTYRISRLLAARPILLDCTFKTGAKLFPSKEIKEKQTFENLLILSSLDISVVEYNRLVG
jgi:hypothetical protein